jgi:hypothetical protein
MGVMSFLLSNRRGFAFTLAVSTGCVDLGALEGGDAGGMADGQAADTGRDAGTDGPVDASRTDGTGKGTCGTGSLPASGSAIVAQDTSLGPYALVAAVGNLYWTNGGSLHVTQESSRPSPGAPSGTCVESTPLSSPRSLEGIYASSTPSDIIVFGSGAQAGGSLGDCCTFTIGESEVPSCGLSTTENCVAWANDGTHTFMAVENGPMIDALYSEPVGMPEDLLTSSTLSMTGLLSAMAAFDGNLYFASSGAIRAITSGGMSQQLATGQAGVLAMAATATDVYWLLSSGTVLSMSVDASLGTAPTQFANLGAPAAQGATLLVGSVYVYVTNGIDSVYAKKIGGALHTLASHENQPRGITVDTGTEPVSVFWANYGDGTIKVAPLL